MPDPKKRPPMHASENATVGCGTGARRVALGVARQRPSRTLASITAIACIVLWLAAPGSAVAQGAGASESTPPSSEALPGWPTRDFSHAVASPVVAVPAGDTIVVRMGDRDVTVRLIGVHVPRSDGGSDEAKVFTGRLLAGESVYVEPDPAWPRQDGDERLWAHVYRAPDGLWLNLELVRQGYARVAAGAEFEQRDLLIAYQRVAQRTHKGLWRQPGALPAAATTQPAPQAVTRPSGDAQTDGTIVYVTPHGRKYHRRDCQFVRSGATAISVEEAKKRGYAPCSRCKPPE
jgi:endonuclease YncB( thermonuclease family)